MSFLEHLEVLRAAVWRAATVALILVATAWFFSGKILDALILYLLRGQKALALSPTEAFSARIEVALWTGGLIALPYVMFELWRFIALAAAVVTPGDGPSMLVLSAPLVLLYFVSLIFAWLIWRARHTSRREPGELG